VTRPDCSSTTYLVGDGIASLAAAVLLIRDGDIPGHTITIIERSVRVGGHMIESKYLCTCTSFFDSRHRWD
jgi:oleate hydratase